mmetsp:Transcript_19816/g.30116  ORF Transcript_19816/g.30116 Transcript_19816/m.30116 type:complete len:90 (+) Transcript_19816:446-715(+)
MDKWTYPQILAMMEGGNAQFENFLQRHDMESMSCYHTKAAQFYREQLRKHVHYVQNLGVYPGRHATRSAATRQQSLKDEQQQQLPTSVQ